MDKNLYSKPKEDSLKNPSAITKIERVIVDVVPNICGLNQGSV